ncbi:MAG: hypothetical protein HOP12_12365 [Candidatus Eisenbacteria bacterium]|uniref:Transporter n=1 Tax=Eiseniibacteriota bacterium TaxID=2212470 RepID=A0A849SGS2_UNCEI|nr:hypothetical protein [Candidatus Eisenbacteria bacterium]
MRRSVRWSVLAFALIVPGAAWGSGYNIWEQSAVAMGMAGTGTAVVGDASAIFHNPAALTRLGKGWHGNGVFHLLHATTSFAGVDPKPGFGTIEEMEPGVFPIPNAYLARVEPNRWAIGIGAFAPFGLGVEWKDPTRFTGREIVTKADLKTVNGNATFAWAFNEQWSVGAGFDALLAEVELNRINRAPYPGSGGLVNVANVKLESDLTPGYGFNAGFAFTPSETWRFGAAYRSSIEVEIEDGKATFDQILANTGNAASDAVFNAQVAAGLPPDQAVGTTLKFPAIWSLGTAWKSGEWTAALDVNLMQWSIFDELALEFEQTPSVNSTIVEEYEDALQVRIGAEHRLEKWTYRFGYYFDQHAAPTESVSPLLPDTNRHGASVGASLPLGWGQGATLDAYELAVFPTRVDTKGVNRDDYNGHYRSFVNVLGIGLSIHF